MDIKLTSIPSKSEIYTYLFKISDEFHEDINDKIQILAIEGKDDKVPRSILEYLVSKGITISHYEFYEYLRSLNNKGKSSCYRSVFKIAEGMESDEDEILIIYSQLLSKAILKSVKNPNCNLDHYISDMASIINSYYKFHDIELVINSIKEIADEMKSYLQPSEYKSALS